MLHLGIDLHRKQMTVSLRKPNGDALLRHQVSTRWPKLEEFRQQLHQSMAAGEEYVAVMNSPITTNSIKISMGVKPFLVSGHIFAY